jgi:anti-anti-sigma factor
MQIHEDPLLREETIRDYLSKRLDAAATEAFEIHFLNCDECFEELRASEFLIAGLRKRRIDRRKLGDIAVLGFTEPAQLTRLSSQMKELSHSVLEQSDTKVLLDLSKVSRVDSAGLGLLMQCYSHAIRHNGSLKLLNPSSQVQHLLRLTRMDSVLEAYSDEQAAVLSFESGG